MLSALIFLPVSFFLIFSLASSEITLPCCDSPYCLTLVSVSLVKPLFQGVFPFPFDPPCSKKLAN